MNSYIFLFNKETLSRQGKQVRFCDSEAGIFSEQGMQTQDKQIFLVLGKKKLTTTNKQTHTKKQ